MTTRAHRRLEGSILLGVGSDNTWQALAGVKYEINKTFSASLGYRYLHIDYDNDGFLYDVDYKGGYLGVSIKF